MLRCLFADQLNRVARTLRTVQGFAANPVDNFSTPSHWTGETLIFCPVFILALSNYLSEAAFSNVLFTKGGFSGTVCTKVGFFAGALPQTPVGEQHSFPGLLVDCGGGSLLSRQRSWHVSIWAGCITWQPSE